MSKVKPDCYKCVHHRSVPGDAHIRCNNIKAHVVGNRHGIENGWFAWPFNFDPTWLVSCDGFSDDPKDNKPTTEASDPLAELLALLGGRL